MKDDRLYLIHMSECIQRIENYTFGGRSEFMQSELIQDAVIRNLQIMAESSQRVSAEQKQRHSEVDWLKITGFRNVLVHDYLGVDLERVWLTIENGPRYTVSQTNRLNRCKEEKMIDQAQKAEYFRSLHHASHALALPNAWDAASARIFEQVGFPAIATTSAGIAAMMGYPDEQMIPRDQMMLILERILASVDVPVTADLEAGYGKTIAEVVETIHQAIRLGVVGVNLEDNTRLPDPPVMDLEYQCDLIRAVRSAAQADGVPLVINARIDIYLREVGAVTGRYDRTLERAAAYLAAGADCVFPIGLSDGVKIARLVQQVDGPINILAGPGTPTVHELDLMGVRRITCGSGLMRSTLPFIQRMGERLLHAEDLSDLFDHPYTYATVNRLFERG